MVKALKEAKKSKTDHKRAKGGYYIKEENYMMRKTFNHKIGKKHYYVVAYEERSYYFKFLDPVNFPMVRDYDFKNLSNKRQ